jgi:hypothetical protein
LHLPDGWHREQERLAPRAGMDEPVRSRLRPAARPGGLTSPDTVTAPPERPAAAASTDTARRLAGHPGLEICRAGVAAPDAADVNRALSPGFSFEHWACTRRARHADYVIR